MIYGFTHIGSGLGNMLHRYVATKVLALDKDCKFSIIGRENFKGSSFMNLDFGQPTPKEWNYTIDPGGKIIVDTHFDNTNEWNEQTQYYNPEFNFVEDNTIIDGEFQDERYWEHREKEVDEWLKVEPLEMPDDLCVIGFRGGEFAVYPDLFLTKEYWDEGIARMKAINPNMRFEVHTDDKVLAQQFFPDFQVIHDIGINWRSARYAKYAIIANSSFFILPRWLRHNNKSCHSCGVNINSHLGGQYWCEKNYHSSNPTKFSNDVITIAPRYWGRHNVKVWSLFQNYYKRFKYI